MGVGVVLFLSWSPSGERPVGEGSVTATPTRAVSTLGSVSTSSTTLAPPDSVTSSVSGGGEPASGVAEAVGDSVLGSGELWCRDGTDRLCWLLGGGETDLGVGWAAFVDPVSGKVSSSAWVRAEGGDQYLFVACREGHVGSVGFVFADPLWDGSLSGSTATVVWRVDEGESHSAAWLAGPGDGYPLSRLADGPSPDRGYVYLVPSSVSGGWRVVRRFVQSLWGAERLAIRAMTPTGHSETAVFDLGGFSATPLSEWENLEACVVTASPEALLDEGAAGTTSTAVSSPTTPATTAAPVTTTTSPTTTRVTVRSAVGVTAGSSYSCVIWADRTLACWGANDDGQTEPPEGEFTALAAGYRHSCGLRPDGTAMCWGANDDGQTEPPGGEFTALAAGYRHSCGLRPDGTIVCWGDDRFGQAGAHGGEFTALAAGGWNSCAVRTDQSVTCWGETFTGAANPPQGEFTAVASGENHSCGIRTDRTVSCWGNNDTRQTDVPDGEFSSVSAGGGTDDEGNFWGRSCGLRVDGTLTCWGSGRGDAPSGRFASVSVGSSHSCGIRTDGSLTCWGGNFDGQSDAPASGFMAVDAGGGTCAIRLDRTVVCWGSNYVWGDEPAGSFVVVAAGGGSGGAHGCGISPQERLVCWGHNLDGQAQPPDGQFETVDAGVDHSCGLRTDRTVVCWGSNVFGQSQPPAGQFTDITAGSWHSCGLRADRTVACWGHNRNRALAPRQLSGSDRVPEDWDHNCLAGIDYGIGHALICWGDNQFGQAHSPQGDFVQVAAGGWHTCGLRSDRSVTCWGDNASGQSQPPDGEFTSIAIGGWHTCGLRTDQTVACWGADGWGQAQPPAGQFEAITAGDGHSCGLRTDGSIICWGRDSFNTVTINTTTSNQ